MQPAWLLLLALLAGAGGGFAGGWAANELNTDPAPTAAATATAAPTADTDAPVPLDARVRAAVEVITPAVVAVVADSSPVRGEDGAVTQERSVGSGVVIDAAGLVVTAYHVIDGAQELSVVLTTGERRPATLVSDDAPFSDLAVLQVPAEGLRAARWGDSGALESGEPVLAVGGGAFATGNAVALGVVSATGRSWPRPGVILHDLVQTDAAINHGDSGGALVNLEGELVGILTTVVRETPNGLAVQGVAFAQSARTLRPIVDAIARAGEFPRPRIGIERHGSQHIELTPALAEAQGLPLPAGALVLEPAPGSAAAEAGVRPGDIVVAVNGAAVDLDHPLVNLLAELGVDAAVELTVARDGRTLTIPLPPTEE